VTSAATLPDSSGGEPSVLLASDRWAGPLAASLSLDGPRRGAVAVRAQGGRVRRVEPGPAGPLLYELTPTRGAVVVEVWGPRATSTGAVTAAVAAARGWGGCDDDPSPLTVAVAGHPLLGRVLREVGEVRLGRVPRVGEALGRAILGQLVQRAEARRSMAQLAALAGTATRWRLWTWPTAREVGATPGWDLRRCGVSLRGARSLHAGALADGRLSDAIGDWSELDRRLRALPGVGAWTSGQTRLALGDPDAVPVGDYHLPTLIGSVLGDGPTDDDGMLALLAPFHGQRGRVLRLVKAGLGRGVVARPARRAPRAAMSAHRYW
jgi:3-methyladenine DNA glycosylase/8-oxoguanine DNA glycosylase